MQHFRKYVFGFLVCAYFFSLVGLPVYFHYCGGQLEKVSYFVKTDSCCDSEEEEEEDNGCCRNEGVFLVNASDFVLKNTIGIKPVEQPAQTFLHHLPSIVPTDLSGSFSANYSRSDHPPGLHHPSLISTSVLRI